MSYVSGRLVLDLLRWLFPYEPPRGVEYDFDELQATYRKWEYAELGLFFVLLAPVIYVLYHTLSWGSAAYIHSRGPAVHVVAPQRFIWFVSAVFGAVVTDGVAVNALTRLILGRDGYRQYSLFGGLRTGIDGKRAGRFTLAVLGIPTFVFIALSVGYYTLFTQDAIVINRFLSLREIRYPYDQVKAIKYVGADDSSAGHSVARSYHVIEFAGGERWTTRDGPRDPEPQADGEIMRYVAERTGKQVQHVRRLEPPGG